MRILTPNLEDSGELSILGRLIDEAYERALDAQQRAPTFGCRLVASLESAVQALDATLGEIRDRQVQPLQILAKYENVDP